MPTWISEGRTLLREEMVVGLSASQSRFLQLTARQSNVEFQGQQINQARVALGNQSASYYQQMWGSSVPTPPAVDEFTKVVYSYNDGGVNNEITHVLAKQNGEYLVSVKSSYSDDFAIVKQGSNIVTRLMNLDENGQWIYDKIDKQKDYQYLRNSDYNTTAHMTRMLNHILPQGDYTTSNGDKFTIYPTGSTEGNGEVDTQDWGKHQDYLVLRDIYEQISSEPELVQKLVDLLYDTRVANPNNADRKNTPQDQELRSRFMDIVEGDICEFFTDGYMIGNTKLRQMGQWPDEEMRMQDPYLKTLDDDKLAKLLEDEVSRLDELNASSLKDKYTDDRYANPIANWTKPSDEGGNWMVRYVQNAGTGSWEPQFYREDELKGTRDNYRTLYDENGNSTSAINFYKVAQDVKEVDTMTGIPARLEYDGSGRYSSITINPGTELEQTFSLTTNTVKDEDAYNSAMNQYNFDKFEYDKMVSEVNLKTKLIQEQDRTLEMKLKQCDTEQRAIQTEMEAISKVVDKNVESTFKTFG